MLVYEILYVSSDCVGGVALGEMTWGGFITRKLLANSLASFERYLVNQ